MTPGFYVTFDPPPADQRIDPTVRWLRDDGTWSAFPEDAIRLDDLASALAAAERGEWICRIDEDGSLNPVGRKQPPVDPLPPRDPAKVHRRIRGAAHFLRPLLSQPVNPSMPSVNNTYRSSYLRSSDVKTSPSGKIIVTIKEVTIEALGEEATEKMVLHFIEEKPPLALNSTNARLIAGTLGDETDAWPGGRLEIGVKPVAFRGTITDGLAVLRVGKRPGTSQKAPPVTQPPPPTQKASETDFADDVPF